ncbi:MAG TPA: hypothetical protein ENH82_06270 [bacterium]|nr:hypothetical protein [bacterium]
MEKLPSVTKDQDTVWNNFNEYVKEKQKIEEISPDEDRTAFIDYLKKNYIVTPDEKAGRKAIADIIRQIKYYFKILINYTKHQENVGSMYRDLYEPSKESLLWSEFVEGIDILRWYGDLPTATLRTSIRRANREFMPSNVDHGKIADLREKLRKISNSHGKEGEFYEIIGPYEEMLKEAILSGESERLGPTDETSIQRRDRVLRKHGVDKWDKQKRAGLLKIIMKSPEYKTTWKILTETHEVDKQDAYRYFGLKNINENPPKTFRIIFEDLEITNGNDLYKEKYLKAQANKSDNQDHERFIESEERSSQSACIKRRKPRRHWRFWSRSTADERGRNTF